VSASSQDTPALPQDERRRRFELLALPHLDAAYNLARWLAGNAADAEDVVQEAYLRAYRFFDSWQGGDIRVWLLTIVRNSFMTWVRENRSSRLEFVADDNESTAGREETLWSQAPKDPETLLLQDLDAAAVTRLVESLPHDYREVLVLRELEDLSYREIAEVAGVPIGTVMSRLTRARALLRRRWQAQDSAEPAHEM
jgi:RNA polymerase sigma-70 factor (ECF subfamily)